METEAVIEKTREWLEAIVIGLELCPFAREPYEGGRVRITVSEATSAVALCDDLVQELAGLDREPPEARETTLLVHPLVLRDFESYNQFLDVADRLLVELDLVGVIQIASFHPAYRFAGAAVDDPANATNRSPYPMLHLLREASVARAVAAHPDPLGIPARNAARLRARARTA